MSRHASHASAEPACATLLHDLPEFAPPSVDVKAFLVARYGAETAHVVLALAVEHQALDQPPADRHLRLDSGLRGGGSSRFRPGWNSVMVSSEAEAEALNAGGHGDN
ncbi:hypothetical protein [Actinoplanes palleronii]|uniref:Uncharacterized protein n=1 Tax=Actinoplanes palleronii TaxID=113570 RepID=A0ABQ4BD24_9ACTN|nr:hypothetical protein [Actinoplanes palleronii]GIE68578.1 hypothetical protein Apa02nite_046860 [Actinoplanes palleronii]